MECAIGCERYGKQRRNPVIATDAYLVGGTEITQRIGNEAVLVELHPAGDVRSMSDDEVCAVVNHCMGDFDDIPTVLAHVFLRPGLDSAELGAFPASVHRKDHDVSLFREPANHFQDAFEVVEICGSLVWSEGADADFEAIFLDDGVWLDRKASVIYAKAIENLCGVALPGRTKVAAVVIGKRKDIKARVLQLWCECFRLAKPVADFGLATLFELAALVQNGAFQVAKCDVG